MNRFEWMNAATVAEASRAGGVPVADAMRSKTGEPASDAVVLKAGGVDLLDLMKEGLVAPARVVNLRSIAALRRIVEEPQDAMRIGALATLEEVAEHPAIRARYAALAEAAGHLASPQLRRMGTLGGNLLQRPQCWYFRSRHHHCARKGGTTCYAYAGENPYHALFHNGSGCAMVHPSTAATALVAFDARVELVNARGSRRVVRLEDFFVRPDQDIVRENDLKRGEVLTAILLPPPGRLVRSVHLRQGELDSFDWPIADAAAVVELAASGECRRASLVLGSAAPVPYRAREAEKLLAGRRVTEETARRAADAALQGAVPLGGNAYKIPVLHALVRRALLRAAAREDRSPVTGATS